MKREVLCVYGMSEEESRKEFSSWLQEIPERELLLLEERTIQENAWKVLLADLQLAPLKYEEEEPHAKELFEKLKFWQIGAEGVLANVKDRGQLVTKNFFANLPFIQESHTARSLEGGFSDVPAIICGAGPSLDRHLHLLRESKDKAVVFAGGSALMALIKAKIRPHFSAALDPSPMPHLFDPESTEKIPFFYQLRVAHWLLSQVKGPKIWAMDGQTYPLEKWVMEQLGVGGEPLETGWNVATFCLSLAIMMGCNPIILVGVDLSLPQGESYAEGLPHNYSHNQLIETSQGTTKADFILAADWIEQLVLANPDRSFYQVSEEAWKISGVRQSSLQEILDNYDKAEIEGKINDLLAVGYPDIAGVQNVQVKWEESLRQADQKCQQMLTLHEQVFPESPCSRGEYALLEVELEEEPAFIYFLQPIWEVWRHLFGPQEKIQQLLFFQSTICEVLHGTI